MPANEKNTLEVSTGDIPHLRTPSDLSVAGSFPEEELASDDQTTLTATTTRKNSEQDLKQTLREYHKTAVRYRSERDHHARHALALEEAVARANDKVATLTDSVERLRNELQDLRLTQRSDRTYREPTTDTHVSSTYSTTAWQRRGTDPDEKLTGLDPDAYGPWRYAIDLKLEVDSPMFPTEKSRIRYTLSQLDLPIFSSMREYAADIRSLTFEDFMEEIEHCIGIHTQQLDARNDLQNIKQNPNEKISEYYHRIRSLWHKAKTPEEDRVHQFLTTMLPNLSGSLLAKQYANVRELLDDARTVEGRKKDIHYNHQHTPRLHHPAIKPPTTTDQRWSTPNANFGPVAKRPEGWLGTWYNPQITPKKLDDAEKIQLTSQGRCWSCRGSGHHSRDTCCPKRTLDSKRAYSMLKAEVEEGALVDSEEETGNWK
jgi:retrotransposon gag protein